MPDRLASPRSILVLGAGMAGLGAARALKDAGASVKVIEARNRIGGRTHTSHLWPDLPVDMGASWIHGTKGNPVTALARAQGLKITPTDYERSVTFDSCGQKVPFVKAAKSALKLVEKARKRVYKADADLSLQVAIEASPEWQQLSEDARRVARLAINTRIEHEYSGDWSRLSAWNFDQGVDFPGDEAVVTPGFGPILAHLAQGLDLRLGEAVRSITPRPEGVEVRTAQGIHFADHAIVTLPLGVLQSGDIRFAEPLSRKRQRAIEGLGMGLLNKCVLRFDRVFWPEDMDWIDFLGPVQTLWADWTSYLPATGHPLIVGFNAARMAEEIEELDDRDTVASAVAALRAMFGTSVPDPSGAQISRWRQDPFALGAYSFKAVGSSRKDRKALFGADWDGRLFFAGEATSADQPATVHGALITGRAAAAALITG
ncbi:FAD-dependent oxidoreductase [Tabrizicola sp. TH137]|uniref:flavin monoamine oxidase family protein n=1 Tax=Tabrizicola sp. TH137 TaxID=2067452 RepID=UPI0020B3D24E|nr:FAD-dependent oxidoreductase [Tabrizicola sp. TH137]